MENSPESNNFGVDIKVILIGNTSTGKTSIVDRYIKNIFDEKPRATIAANFSYKIIKKEERFFRLQFWDIPGQDRSPSLTSIFCRDAQGIVFCCDALNKKSREDILIWQKSLEGFINITNLPIILMENKCDLLGEEEKYNDNIDELKIFSENNNFSGYFRTSALNGYNVEKAMDFLVNEIIRNLDKEEAKNSQNNKKLAAKLKSSPKDDKTRCC